MTPEDPDARAMTPATDDYQAKYMAGAGALYHDKIRAPRFYHLLFLLPIVVVVGAAIAAAIKGGPAPALTTLVPLVMLPIAWALFAVLRISVTPKEVIVQYGVFGPKIPLEAIESCASVAYDWKKYGGWGIRVGIDGSVAYNMLGDRGRAVRITWKSGRFTRTVLLSSNDPDRLAAAINQARAAAAGGARFAEQAAKVRVREEEFDAADDEAATEDTASASAKRRA